MKRIHAHKKLAVSAVITALLAIILTGCSYLQATISKITGDLVGSDFIITEYDNFGNTNFRVAGDKVNLKGDVDEDGELVSSYIDITIDGYEWNHVGSTLVFAEHGADMITDFQLPEDTMTTSQTSSGLMPVDRFVNNYRNLMGKKAVVLISTQNGTPIGLFQGNDCYTDIPENLPKTTMVYIDGKRVYVHKADIDIIPVELFENYDKLF